MSICLTGKPETALFRSRGQRRHCAQQLIEFQAKPALACNNHTIRMKPNDDHRPTRLEFAFSLQVASCNLKRLLIKSVRCLIGFLSSNNKNNNNSATKTLAIMAPFANGKEIAHQNADNESA